MEETKDANTTPDSSSGETETKEVILEPVKTDDGYISTFDFVEKAKDADTSEDAEQNTSETESEEKKNFDEHPRFQELIKEKNELKAKLEQISQPDYETEINALKQQIAQIQQPVQQQIPPISNIEFLDMFAENPLKVLSEYGEQIRTQAVQDTLTQFQQSQQQQSVQQLEQQQLETFQNFFQTNPKAEKMWESGEISAYMAEHPGHNAISAYTEMTHDEQIKEATEKAVQEALEKQKQQLKAAGKASTLSSNPITPNVGKKQITATDKFSQMIARWKAREA